MAGLAGRESKIEPTNFGDSNCILGPPEGLSEDTCKSIFAYRGEMPSGVKVVVTCWKPNREELQQLLKGARVWLLIMGVNQPPVVLSTNSPFEEPK
mgnify:FL=1